jgi:hypothetical protein
LLKKKEKKGKEEGKKKEKEKGKKEEKEEGKERSKKKREREKEKERRCVTQSVDVRYEGNNTYHHLLHVRHMKRFSRKTNRFMQRSRNFHHTGNR